jgi:hypothetical protein
VIRQHNEDAMSRWRGIVEDAIGDLESMVRKGGKFRDRITEVIVRHEEDAANEVPEPFDEKREKRIGEFRAALRKAISEHLKKDPSNAGLCEAKKLFDYPRLRLTDK